jgi:HEAT repeat protein
VQPLGARGPAGAPAVPGLTELLRDKKNPDLRRVAAGALGRIGPAARKAIPELRAALQDEDNAVREQAAEALKRLEPPPKPGQ